MHATSCFNQNTISHVINMIRFLEKKAAILLTRLFPPKFDLLAVSLCLLKPLKYLPFKGFIQLTGSFSL